MKDEPLLLLLNKKQRTMNMCVGYYQTFSLSTILNTIKFNIEENLYG